MTEQIARGAVYQSSLPDLFIKTPGIIKKPITDSLSISGILLPEPNAELFQSRREVGCITILKKLGITWMRTQHLARMLDRTKILLCSRHDLTSIGDQSIAVGAIGAMKFFDEVQIFELLPRRTRAIL